MKPTKPKETKKLPPAMAEGATLNTKESTIKTPETALKKPKSTIAEAAPPNPKLKDAFFHKVFESEERLQNLVAFLQGQPMTSVDFNMSYEEVVTYLDQNQIPERLVSYQTQDLFWYAMFANCATYVLAAKKELKLVAPRNVSTVFEVCTLFSQRGIFQDLFQQRKVCNMAALQYSRKEQIEWIGREEGREEKEKEIILRMYQRGMALPEIELLTGIPTERVKKLL